jgi:basic membrane lipoprotein Med (substrate-binding protein (PBP1-ABC) superfamily)
MTPKTYLINSFRSLFLLGYTVLVLFGPAFGCIRFAHLSTHQVLVGFCMDIMGSEEPVFTKPFLASLQQLKAKGKIRLTILPSRFASEYPSALSALAKRNHLVFCGPLFSDVIAKAAEEYPETNFVLMQAIPKGITADIISLPNLQWILYRKEDCAFLMSQISQHYPEKASCWLVTDLPDHDPLRMYQKNAFQMGFSDHRSAVLEWPIQAIADNQWRQKQTDETSIFCVTEGAYIPSFLTWFSGLPLTEKALIMPTEAFSDELGTYVLGTVLKEYALTLEHTLDSLIESSWKPGVHFKGIDNNGYSVKLNDKYWSSNLKSEVESILNATFSPVK